MPRTFSPVQLDEPRDVLADAEVRGFGLPDVPGLADALDERYRAEAAITEAEVERMADLSLDPAMCEWAGGVAWCPRCGFGCCSVVKDPGDRTRHLCNGGCDAGGQHAVHVRTGPEYRSIRDCGDALGRIDPATTPAFLSLVKDRHGQSGFLQVDGAGNVTVKATCLPIGPDEARALGEYVTAHNAVATSATTTVAA